MLKASKMIGPPRGRLCRLCKGERYMTVKSASGKQTARLCPACGGTGTEGLATK